MEKEKKEKKTTSSPFQIALTTNETICYHWCGLTAAQTRREHANTTHIRATVHPVDFVAGSLDGAIEFFKRL